MSGNAVLKFKEGGLVAFWCPGCNQSHEITIESGRGRPVWTYNNNPVKPTFQPSVLARCGHYSPNYDGEHCWCAYYKENPQEVQDFKCFQCHSFVTDGQIQFLDDCSHSLVGQTVPLPVWPDSEEGLSNV